MAENKKRGIVEMELNGEVKRLRFCGLQRTLPGLLLIKYINK
ncbi:hypothetical protein DCCM_4082 [Desulfocucumis palustris]|uniref:Uncharacterized protein n=1 Tax=Desulfocucumis palustris TaxID=1898651 RepID=A0A2L2XLY2_9FIRM|nr:hypothetical protein [Desulfocucumis palustris]GBF34961.1 hypothetical protein DCCM_4082 [Desulfocucumis palustris]